MSKTNAAANKYRRVALSVISDKSMCWKPSEKKTMRTTAATCVSEETLRAWLVKYIGEGPLADAFVEQFMSEIE